MSVTRRTRLSVIAAAASGALVVAMTGTALAADHLDRPTCSDIDLQDAQDAVAPSDRHRLDDLCKSVRTRLSDDIEESDQDATPDTTPAAADDEDSDDGDRDCADDDGIVCEDHFDTDDQQVAVRPKGGVARTTWWRTPGR
jgi:hypothetical protein